MRAAGEPLWPHFGFGDPLLRRVLLLMVPITITLGILNFNALIDTYFAQFVSDQAAAEIGYSFRLYQLPQGIFAVTIGTVLFPSLSRFAAQKDEDGSATPLSMGVRQMVFVSLPFLAWFTVMPQAFVRMVYERGQFGSGATVEVAGALAAVLAGARVRQLNIMFNRAFQSMQKPWLPMYVSFANLALNVLLAGCCYKPLGVPGITLCMATVSAVNLFALVCLLRREIGRIDGRRIAKAAGGALLAAAALAAVSDGLWLALQDFAAGGFLPLVAVVIAAVVAGGVVYLGLAKLLRLEELSVVRRCCGAGAAAAAGRRRARMGRRRSSSRTPEARRGAIRERPARQQPAGGGGAESGDGPEPALPGRRHRGHHPRAYVRTAYRRYTVPAAKRRSCRSSSGRRTPSGSTRVPPPTTCGTRNSRSSSTSPAPSACAASSGPPTPRSLVAEAFSRRTSSGSKARSIRARAIDTSVSDRE